MSGMSRRTGKAIDDKEHIEQSLEDIVTTRIGWRVIVRDYGSNLFDQIDMPIGSPSSKMDLYAAVHDAVDRWEKRITLKQVSLVHDARATAAVEDGSQTLQLTGTYKVDGSPFNFTLRLPG